MSSMHKNMKNRKYFKDKYIKNDANKSGEKYM